MTITLFFCPECGTLLWKEATRDEFRGLKVALVGTLSDAEALKGGVDAEFYVKERMSWLSRLAGTAQKSEF